ncbi:MAG: DUF1566 domain-containing protein [Dokdonella sp.]
MLDETASPADVPAPSTSATESPRFVAYADTVFDRVRRLEWSRKPISPDRFEHAAAVTACANFRLGGHADWRLPTREELQSLVDYDRYNPAINRELFHDTPASDFWSSSPGASVPACAWIVFFYYGHVGLLRRDHGAFVRAVRSVPASQ